MIAGAVLLGRPPRAVLWHDAAFSLAVHLLAFGLPYYLLVVRRPVPIVVELALTAAPLPARRSGVAHARPAKAWAPAATGASAMSASGSDAEESAACPPPCPDTPGAFVPAGLAEVQPRWIGGFIEESDYPASSRRNGEEGVAMLTVFLTAEGRVRDVRLARASGHGDLDRTALEKVRAAAFSPARDSSGRAVPCKILLPIRFELH